MKLPNLNPIIAPDAICSTCGNTMKMTPDVGAMKRVQGVWYSCVNEATGCSYRVYSDARLSGQTVPNPKE